MRSSELLDKFFKDKDSDWSNAPKTDTTMCGAFVDVMQDPVLADIDGGMVLEYRLRLAKLPDHVGTARVGPEDLQATARRRS